MNTKLKFAFEKETKFSPRRRASASDPLKDALTTISRRLQSAKAGQ